MADDQRQAIGPAGRILATNIRRIREGLLLTYVELSERMTEIGRPIPVIGLRRIEREERRVDVDDLMALAAVLNVAPVDLLVPNDVEDGRDYLVAESRSSTAGTVRRWVGGHAPLAPISTAADFAQAIRWMPQDRATEWTREFYLPIQDAWLRSEAKRGREEGDEI